MDRPHTILSCAVSVDGRIDDTGPERLRLSNEADFAEIDELRAQCDAILVGAGTLRNDDPRLLVRSERLRARRRERGLTENLLKAVVTRTGDLDPGARLFTTGDAGAVVYTGGDGVGRARDRFAGRPGGLPPVDVVDAGDPPTVEAIQADLAARGVRRLLVEGGGRIHTLFLTSGLVDELRLAVAPFFVGEADAPSFVHPGAFTATPAAPMRLVEARAVGDIAVLRYRLDAEGAA
ncbi:RibD family protein [Nocardiopsis changdeensis]|uniref:Dihydrofolate reductase family protein n=1 Tax=Nocardiopsis changdeensis TaxID=2831969 RepID=A0ABX8BJ80_9ACTN|nr:MULTISPECIES: dihydrofolate reductase family protein [Nocardiopsis]QUX21374.1 dihydrofolate reductase family protein [Nocardiopsis changdeensis]QYX37305.1 dihydrofolate reductase family protein [Nocardiopsis sp. MT53]